jgi:hypothetical protein
MSHCITLCNHHIPKRRGRLSGGKKKIQVSNMSVYVRNPEQILCLSFQWTTFHGGGPTYSTIVIHYMIPVSGQAPLQVSISNITWNPTFFCLWDLTKEGLLQSLGAHFQKFTICKQGFILWHCRKTQIDLMHFYFLWNILFHFLTIWNTCTSRT